MMRLLKLETGEVCWAVNGQIIMTADPDFDDTSKVEEAAKKLAAALNLELLVIHANAVHNAQGIDWPAVIRSLR